MAHQKWIVFSGITWLCIGVFLLSKGFRFLPPGGDTFPWIALGFFIGLLKGRFVLAKTVRRVAKRIASLSQPIRLSDVYSPSYVLLIAGMVLLGVSLRFLPISTAVRGTIDIAIGSALIHGALLYFRAAIYGIDCLDRSR